MANNKRSKVIKKQSSKDGYSPLVSALLSVFLVAVGVLLAFMELAPRSAIKVTRIEDHMLEPGQKVYYVAGDTHGGDYEGKLQPLTEGVSGKYSFGEDELNSFLSARYVAPKPAESDASPLVRFSPRLPNIRVVGDVFQVVMDVGVKTDFRIPYTNELNKTFRLLVKGKFEGKRGEFVPHEVYIGGARIPPYILGALLVNTSVGYFVKQDSFSEYKSVWASLDSVRVNGDRLTLTKK